MMPQLISKPCAVKLGISFLSRPQIRWHPDRFLVLNPQPATVLSHFIFRHAGCAACILFQDLAAAMPTPRKLIRQQLFLPAPLFLPSLPCRHRRRRRRRGGQLGKFLPNCRDKNVSLEEELRLSRLLCGCKWRLASFAPKLFLLYCNVHSVVRPSTACLSI